MKLNLTLCSYSYNSIFIISRHIPVFSMIDLVNKITGPCTSVSSHKRIKSFHLIIISRGFITFMHKKSISVRDERIRTYMRVPGNPDRDACIRLALNCGLDQDNPVSI